MYAADGAEKERKKNMQDRSRFIGDSDERSIELHYVPSVLSLQYLFVFLVPVLFCGLDELGRDIKRGGWTFFILKLSPSHFDRNLWPFCVIGEI